MKIPIKKIDNPILEEALLNVIFFNSTKIKNIKTLIKAKVNKCK